MSGMETATCAARHPHLPMRCVEAAGHDQHETPHATWRGEKWTSEVEH